jgi:tetratricopeptide (TPR) repeat protein
MKSNYAMSINDWLQQVQDHGGDSQWLTSQEEALFSVIYDGLHSHATFHAAVEILIMVFTHFAMVLYHVQRWSSLLLDALLEAQTLRDSEMQIRIFTLLGQSYIMRGKSAAAQDALLIALNRAQEGNFKEMMLTAYIILIRTMYVNAPQTLEADTVLKALALADEVKNSDLKATLYGALALVYSRSDDTSQQVLAYAQTSYAYWYGAHNELEMARMAYLLVGVYRLVGRLDHAGQWLERTAKLFEKTEFQRQYTLLAYEQGTLYLLQEENEAAEQWLKMSLEEARKIDSQEYMASAYHALGLVYTNLQRYDEAQSQLQEAITQWRAVGDFFELASAYEARAYLEHKRGNRDEAQRWLETALVLCPQIPQENQRAHREKKIRELMDEIG